MTYNVKEGIRKQRMKILPVSFAMLLVATLVRAPIPRVYVYLISAFVPSILSLSGSGESMVSSTKREGVSERSTRISRLEQVSSG